MTTTVTPDNGEHKRPLLLSIAVPTYNRAPRLRQCLEMIADRIAELAPLAVEIEVLVVDNASSDETPQVIASARSHFARLVYVRNESNLGIDGNIHRCSQLATGTYVQFLSDDDILLPGALRHVVEHLLDQPQVDFFFLNVISFANELPAEADFEPRIRLARDLVCTNQDQLIATCGIWLTFLSSFVFRRAAWNRSAALERYIGTDIYLSYALFDLLSKAHTSVILARPLVAARAYFSGSYRIFYAFGYQWAELLLEHAPRIGFDEEKMQAVLRQSIRTDLIWRVLYYRLQDRELSDEECSYIFHGACSLSVATCLLWLAVRVPRSLLTTSFTCIKSARRVIRLI